MPQWKSEWEKLVDYLAATYPGTSIGVNARGLVSNLSHDDLDEAAFAAMVADAQIQFPLAFELPKDPAPEAAPAPAARRMRDCPECGEPVLAVAKKCRYCLSPIEPLA